MRTIKIRPNSYSEYRFKNLLNKVGAKPELIICRKGSEYGMDHDEYLISDALFRLIQEQSELIRERSSY